jgi:hypothetical protein
LYDIARMKENGNTVTYLCLQDHKEESLIAKTRHINSNAQQMPLQNKARLIIDKIIKTGICTEPNSLLSTQVSALFLKCAEVQYSGPFLQISPPPPQSFC